MTEETANIVTDSKTNEYLDLLEESSDLIELYPAQDFKDEKLWYAFENSIGIHLVNSDREIIQLNDAKKYNIKVMSSPYSFGLKIDTLRFYSTSRPIEKEDEPREIFSVHLFLELVKYLKRFIYTDNSALYDILALWVMHTYVFSMFDYTPYLHIQAEKRSGKSVSLHGRSPQAGRVRSWHVINRPNK